MKITKDLIGKKVSKESWHEGSWIIVVWVRGAKFAGIDNHGFSFTGDNGLSDIWKLWTEPAKPKKPSETIRNLAMTEKAILPPDRALIEAIIQYLDEKEEAGKP